MFSTSRFMTGALMAAIFMTSSVAAKALTDEGGIEVYVAAEKPEGVPDENWLPLNRGDYDIDVILQLYVADLDKFKTWSPPVAEEL